MKLFGVLLLLATLSAGENNSNSVTHTYMHKMLICSAYSTKEKGCRVKNWS